MMKTLAVSWCGVFLQIAVLKIPSMNFANFLPEFIEQMNALLGDNQLKLPPPIFIEMAGEFITLDLTEKRIEIRFPVRERYQNPMGYMYR